MPTDYIAAYRNPTDPYHREAIDHVRSFRAGKTTIDGVGVLRWVSNGAVPFNDVCELAFHVGLPVDLKACDVARADYASKAIAAYKEARKTRTPDQVREERASARAAHGPGVELVNVLTGERWTT